MPRRAPPPDDLGPVRFSITTEYGPRDQREAVPQDVMGGPLAALVASHGAVYRGKWSAHVGSCPINLKTHVHTDAIEELFVFLIEVVDGGFGEWILRDKDDVLIVEAQVYGPDVELEFGDADGNKPTFRRVQFPKRAKVRLRALVEECGRFLGRLIVDVTVADPDFAGADEVRADLDSLLGAVSNLPLEFKSRDAS